MISLAKEGKSMPRRIVLKFIHKHQGVEQFFVMYKINEKKKNCMFFFSEKGRVKLIGKLDKLGVFLYHFILRLGISNHISFLRVCAPS